MNTLKNRVQLIGNLGRDPEIKNFDGGKKMVKVSVATNETYKNTAGEKVTETNWHNLVAWGKTAELAEKYLKKGSEVAVDGRLVTRSYDDKEGAKHYITEVIVQEFLILDTKN